MSKSVNPKWILNDDWAVSTDAFNWILYHRSGKAWRATGYYATPEMLLKSLFRKLTRTESPQPTLERHVKHCLERAQAAADCLFSQLATYPLPTRMARPPAVAAMLEQQEAQHAS